MAESLFTSQTPAGGFNDGTPGITTSTTLKFAVSGTITKIRWYVVNPFNGETWTGLVWEVTSTDAGGAGAGTLLNGPSGDVAGFTPTVDAWNLITLASPISVTADKLYRIGMHNQSRYCLTNSAFDGVDITNGNITAHRNGADPLGNGWAIRQGAFIVSATVTAYPTQVGTSAAYFVDVEFEPDVVDEEGSAALVLPALTLAGAASVDATGASSLTLPHITAAGAARVDATGAGALTLPHITATGAATVDATGASALILPALTLAGAGTAGVAGAAALTLPALTLAGAGETAPVLEGALMLPALTLAATTTAVVTETGGNWNSLYLGLNEARAAHALAEQRRRRPVECPTDGWPLEERDGVLHCKFGGHIVRTY